MDNNKIHWKQMFLEPLPTVWTPPTPHIKLNFISGMVWDDFIGTAFKIRQWSWHIPLLGENPYLEICLTNFNQIRYITFFSYFYVIVWKWAKSVCNHAYFPYNRILNSIWCFHFPVCRSSNNDYIGVKLCVKYAFKVCQLWPKIV